eukprot:SAG31_NODE_8916_length_1364_cov_1.048221_2_plen_239_part_00
MRCFLSFCTYAAPALVLRAVRWNRCRECRIAHGGTCEITLSTAPVGTAAGQGTPPINTFQTLAPTFACCQNTGPDSRTVTVPPDATGTNAVLRWMWDGDAPYNDCSDLALQAANTGGGRNDDDDTDEGGGNNKKKNNNANLKGFQEPPDGTKPSPVLIAMAAVIYGFIFLLAFYYYFCCKLSENMLSPGTGPNGGYTGEDRCNGCFESFVTTAPSVNGLVGLLLMAAQVCSDLFAAVQ